MVITIKLKTLLLLFVFWGFYNIKTIVKHGLTWKISVSIKYPHVKMVSSQCGIFDDGKLEKFSECFSKLTRTMFPKDFLWYDKKSGSFVWYYIYREEMTVPDKFSIIDFPEDSMPLLQISMDRMIRK